ncbi:MAG TPA: hypothetical protein PKC18_08810 [Lacipirellulaceae bacterium]|nr:hypothetical protein [Lacipirellulaceae bacterium]
MLRTVKSSALAVVVLATAAATVGAAPPFLQDFNDGVSAWRFNATTNNPPLIAMASGGPDGGAFIRNELAALQGSAQASTTILLFRAHKTFAGIDSSYAGDWITAGVKQVSVWVRHDAPEPLEFIARFAPEFNFPGAFYAASTLVEGGSWTQVFFNVTPNSPQNVTHEGGTYEQIFQGFAPDFNGVSNMQFGVYIPPSLVGTGPYTFDLDKVQVSLTPEPGSAVLALVGAAVLGSLARRRR